MTEHQLPLNFPSGLIPDAQAAVEAGRAGEALAYSAANTDWKEHALRGLRAVCATKATFTVDDIWRWLDACRFERPDEPRAIAGVLSEAARLGWCEKTGEWVRGTQPKSHANPRQVWRSLIHQPR